MKAYMRNRKGVTIAETVIALVIIAAISAVTLSMIIMSIGVESKSIAAIETKNAAENSAAFLFIPYPAQWHRPRCGR